jgi:hypothetical protein
MSEIQPDELGRAGDPELIGDVAQKVRRLEAVLRRYSPDVQEEMVTYIRDKYRDDDLFMERFAPDPAVEPAEDLTFFDDSYRHISPEFEATARANLPYSAAELGREAEEIGRDIPGFLGKLAAIGRDLPGAPASALGLVPPGQSPDNLAVDFTKELWKSVSDPREVARHPLGAVSTVLSPVKGPVRPLLRQAGKVIKKTAPTVRKAFEVGGKVSSELPGMTTGEGGMGIRDLVGSGVGSGQRATRARTQIGTGTAKDIGNTVINRIKTELDGLKKQKDIALKKFDEPVAGRQRVLDVENIGREILGDLDQAGEGGILASKGVRAKVRRAEEGSKSAVRVGDELVEIELNSITKKSDQRAIIQIIEEVTEKRQLTGAELDDLKLRLDDVYKGLGSDRGRRLIAKLRAPFREKLGEIEGYNRPVQEMSELFDFLDEAEAELGRGTILRAKDKKKPVASRVSKALQKGYTKEGAAVLSDVVNKLDERFSGLGLRDRLPAQRMQSMVPSGLIGRAGVAEAARIALVTIIAGGAYYSGSPAVAVAGAIGGLAISSPKVVGRAAIEAGATARQAQRLTDFIKKSSASAEARGINTSTMSVSQLVQRTLNLQEEEQPKGQFLRSLNRIQTGLNPPAR